MRPDYLSVYANQDKDYVNVISQYEISKIAVNVGQNANTLVVSVSQDGNDWIEVQTQKITTEKTEYTFDLSAYNYKYVKLWFSEESNHLRIYDITITSIQ